VYGISLGALVSLGMAAWASQRLPIGE
jgi:hypothetical protein